MGVNGPLGMRDRRLVPLLLAIGVGLIVLAVVLPVMAQAAESDDDPLELYNANDNGVIDAEEAITAVVDYLEDRIDRALASAVLELYWATVESGTGRSAAAQSEDGWSWVPICITYDNAGNGNRKTDEDEITAATDDYFNDRITVDEILDIIGCFFDDTPEQVGTPTATAGVNSIDVEWSAPGPGKSAITAYYVRHKKDDDTSWPTGNEVTDTSTTIPGLAPATTYNIQVQACNNAAGCGDWSDSATIKTNAVALARHLRRRV